VRATTSTTIRGVSILSGRRRSRAEVFDIALSPTGIEIRWRGRPTTRMPWDRVSQWEIEERRGGVLLTLHGDGTTTPLVVPGWTPDDLEVIMRNTAGAGDEASGVDAPGDETPRDETSSRMPPAPFRMERRRRIWTRRRRAPSWKVVATAVLLGLLATAVTLVLLQSAGVISWSFLGPTA